MAEAPDTVGGLSQAFAERVAAGDAFGAVDQLRAEFDRDPWAAQLGVNDLLPYGLGGLRAAAAARALLYERMDEPAAAITGWVLARDEAIDDPDRPDQRMADLASAEIERLGGRSSAAISVSVRAVARELLGVFQSAVSFASALAVDHAHLGEGLLGQVVFSGFGGPMQPMLFWLAPIVRASQEPEVVDTTLVLLGLADRDAEVAAALHGVGCDAAMQRELARKGWVHRPWLAALAGARLVTTTRRTIEAGGNPASAGDITAAEWGRVDGENRALLGTGRGEVVAWSSSRPLHWLKEGGPRPVRGLAGDEQSLLVWDDLAIDGPVAVAGLDGTGDMTFATISGPGVELGRANDLLADKFVEPELPVRRSPTLASGAYPDDPLTQIAVGRDDDEVLIVVGGNGVVAGWWSDQGIVREFDGRFDIRCTALAAGDRASRGCVAYATRQSESPPEIRVMDSGTGAPIAILFPGDGVVDLDWSDLDERDVLSAVDTTGEVRVWDIRDLRLLTVPSRRILGAATARFGEEGGRPALLIRTVEGTAEVRTLALATVVDEIPEYRSDDVTGVRREATRKADALEREVEADAIAEVVTSRRVQPPLAIGLFGEWGEGKSYFMQRIQRYVDERAETAVAGDEICRGVRQVTFNAWHYAETDLWASLVFHLFDQLALPERADGAVEVDQRGMTLLRSEIVRARKVQSRLEQARQLAADLDAKLARSRAPDFDDVDPGDRAALEGLVGEERARRLYAGYVAGRSAPRRMAASAAAVWTALWRPRRRWVCLGALVVIAALVVLALQLGGWAALAAGLGALVPAAASAAGVARVAGRVTEGWQHLRDRSLELADRADRGLAPDRVRRDVARAEVAELEAEYLRTLAAGQLAGVLEDRLKDGSYRSRLGLMSRIHEDLRTMAELLAASGAARRRSDVAADLPLIDRIVLYIDDLDRCPPKRVVEILEAIHLLLAINLFVVVVAVDPRWLLRALTAHYRQLLADPEGAPREGPDAELWRSTPMHYLEKIFQLPFTLAPLTADRYVRYVDSLSEPVVAPGGAGSPATRTGPTGGPLVTSVSADALQAAGTVVESAPAAPGRRTLRPVRRPALPRPPDAQQLDPLTLHPDELAFLKLLGPPLVTTPRSVKRVLNSYGLLLAITQRERRAEILGPVSVDEDRKIRPHRAVLTLLAVVVGAPDQAPTFFRVLHEAALATPTRSWPEFLRQQRGDLAPLAGMLERIGTSATQLDDGLGVPGQLGDWKPWVVPCGRFSFETGRVVVRLDGP